MSTACTLSIVQFSSLIDKVLDFKPSNGGVETSKETTLF
jgi:hypothetical protein